MQSLLKKVFQIFSLRCWQNQSSEFIGELQMILIYSLKQAQEVVYVTISFGNHWLMSLYIHVWTQQNI